MSTIVLIFVALSNWTTLKQVKHWKWGEFIMDFRMPESHEMLRKAVRDFCVKEVIPNADKWEQQEYMPLDLLKKMGQLGFFSCPFPKEYNGSEMGWLANVIVSEEVGRAWVSLATQFANLNSGMCPMIIMIGGNEAQKRKYLPRLATGEIMGCFALTEPNAATDAAGIETRAISDGNNYILNGTKIWATGSTLCGVAVLIAKTDLSKRHDGISCFLIEPNNTQGITTEDIHNKMGARSAKSGYIRMEDARIPKECLLGEEGKGWMLAMSGLQYGRLTVGARALGLAQACLDAGVFYATTRKQFGQEIGRFQLIKLLISEMLVSVEAARLLLYRAAWRADEKLPFAHEANIAKLVCSEAGAKSANLVQQIYGAYGYSADFPVARYFRDSMLFCAGEGSNMLQKIITADDVLGFKKAEARRATEHIAGSTN